MCLGYPDQDPAIKPRLPHTLMCYENQYRLLESEDEEIKKYNSILAAYYQQRSGEPQQWQTAIEKTLAKPVRPHILPFFQKQGLLKK